MASNIQRQSPETGAPAVSGRGALMSLRDEVDRLFDTFFSAPFARPGGMFELDPFRRLGGVFRMDGGLNPEVDVKETGEKYEITAELPGLDEKDVEVTVREGVLAISGEKKMETKEEKADYHLTERTYGKFVRAFRLPETADTDKIAAEFSKGVLTVTVPKHEEAQKQEKKIDVKVH